MNLNPTGIADVIINMIEDGTDGTIIPSSPLKSFVDSVAGTNLEFATYIEKSKAKRFPYLAKDMDSLTYHITDEDERGLFASPSKTRIRFFISVQDIINNGIYSNGVYNVTIPKYTKIKIDDLVFLIETPIRITLKQTNGYYPFVERINIDGDVITSIGVLKSIITSSQNTEWLVFEDELSQLDLEIYEYPITLDNQIDFDVDFSGSYYYTSKLYMRYDGVTSPVRKVYNASIIEDSPMVLVKPETDKVTYSIPPALVHKNTIRGTLIIYLYTTKGKIRKNLKDRGDFKIVFPPKFDTVEEAVADSIDMFALSPYIMDGGNNPRVFRDIKKKIINRTTGEFGRPLALTELTETARLRGFSIFPIERNIVSVTYAANKETPPGISNVINMDVYIDGNDYQGITHGDNYTIIDSNTVTIDGKPVTKETYEKLSNIEFLKDTVNNSLTLFTPFRYISDNYDGYRDNRAYYDKPKIDNIYIIDKNREVTINVNIDAMDISLTKETKNTVEYKISIGLIGNDKFEQLFASNGILAQLSIPLANSKDGVTQRVSLTKVEDKLEARIVVDKYINRDNEVRLYSGANEVGLDAYIEIFSKVHLIIYTQTEYIGTIMAPTSNSYIYLEDGVKPLPINSSNIGIVRETFELTIATHLKYLWAYNKSIYLGRKVKTYDIDVYAKYKEDVYKRDEVSGCEIIPVWDDETSQCLDAKIEIDHYRGDYILDSEGNKIIEHHKGDPVIINGIPMYEDGYDEAIITNLTLLEYGYLALNRSEYESLDDTIELLVQWVTYDIPAIKSKLIERTNLLLLSQRDMGKPVIDKRNKAYTSVISPSVKVYIRDIIDTSARDNIKNVIHATLEKYFNKAYISLDAMEKEIRDLTGVEAVTVYNHTKDNDRVIDIKSNRFTIKKVITDSNMLELDIKIEINMI